MGPRRAAPALTRLGYPSWSPHGSPTRQHLLRPLRPRGRHWAGQGAGPRAKLLGTQVINVFSQAVGHCWYFQSCPRDLSPRPPLPLQGPQSLGYSEEAHRPLPSPPSPPAWPWQCGAVELLPPSPPFPLSIGWPIAFSPDPSSLPTCPEPSPPTGLPLLSSPSLSILNHPQGSEGQDGAGPPLPGPPTAPSLRPPNTTAWSSLTFVPHSTTWPPFSWPTSDTPAACTA